MIFGSSEHAEAVTEGRHPGIRDGLQWLTFTHLPSSLQQFSEPFYTTAVEVISRIGTDSPELTTAINALIAAKDSGVRAGIRHDTGRAGSVPRPQTVVGPPRFSPAAIGMSIPQNPGEPYMDYLNRASRQLDAEQAAPIQDRPPA